MLGREGLGPSPEEMGFSPTEMDIPKDDAAHEGIEGDTMQEARKLFSEAAEAALLEQLDGVENNGNAQAWIEPFKSAFLKVKDSVGNLGRASVIGASAIFSAGNAYNAVEAFSQRDMGKAVLSVAGFILTGAAYGGRGGMREAKAQNFGHAKEGAPQDEVGKNNPDAERVETESGEVPQKLLPVEMRIDERGHIYTESRPEEVQRSWASAFSDPKDHNPKEFCYVVHGLQNEDSRMLQMMAILGSERDGYGTHDRSQNIDLSTNPERVIDKKVISCSVVDQDHTETFGPVGLILKTPVKNIVKAAGEDIGTDFANPDNVVAGGESRMIPTVEELLSQTAPSTYNEVVVQGKTDDGNVEILGLFIRAYADGEPVDGEMARKIRYLSNRLGLPLINIEEKGADYGDERPQIMKEASGTSVGVSVNRGGYRYVIDFKEDNYYKLDNKYNRQNITQEEFREVMEAFSSESEGVDGEELSEALGRMEDMYSRIESGGRANL